MGGSRSRGRFGDGFPFNLINNVHCAARGWVGVEMCALASPERGCLDSSEPECMCILTAVLCRA